MENYDCQQNPGKTVSKLVLWFMCILMCLPLFNRAIAGAGIGKAGNNHDHQLKKLSLDTEKKVDYLERIYFSGKNKEGLSTLILITVQALEGRPATKAVAQQYLFLAGIKEKADAADNACEIEEMLAAGIYGIDASEAVQQNIPRPGSEAALKADEALANVGKLANSTNNLNASVFKLRAGSYTSYNNPGNVYKSYSTYNKVAGVTSTFGDATQTVGSGKQVVDQVSNTLKSFGLHKDKPCKNVVPKDIEIGQHALPDTTKNVIPQVAAGTRIIIKNINYNQLSSIASSIQKINGVSSLNSDDFNNNIATILIVHNMKMKELLDKILQSNKVINLDVQSISANAATLAIK